MSKNRRNNAMIEQEFNKGKLQVSVSSTSNGINKQLSAAAKDCSNYEQPTAGRFP